MAVWKSVFAEQTNEPHLENNAQYSEMKWFTTCECGRMDWNCRRRVILKKNQINFLITRSSKREFYVKPFSRQVSGPAHPLLKSYDVSEMEHVTMWFRILASSAICCHMEKKHSSSNKTGCQGNEPKLLHTNELCLSKTDRIFDKKSNIFLAWKWKIRTSSVTKREKKKSRGDKWLCVFFSIFFRDISLRSPIWIDSIAKHHFIATIMSDAFDLFIVE